MRTIFVLLAVLAGFAAFAMPPQEDGVIPEMEFFQSDDDELGAAETVAVMRKKGATDSDCLKAAEDSFEMVKGDVKTAQDAIDKAINGASKCNDKGASEIAEAIKEQKKQNNNVVSLAKELKAKKAVTFKAAVEAPFEDIKSSLQKKVSDASYLKDSLLKSFFAAKKKVNDVNKELDEGRGKAKEADKSVTKAEKKAKNAKKDCQCKSYKAYQDAVEAAKKTSNSRSKAWTRAAAIKCAVTQGGKKCKTEAEPVVQDKSLPQGVNKKACTAQKKAPVNPACCTDKENDTKKQEAKSLEVNVKAAKKAHAKEKTTATKANHIRLKKKYARQHREHEVKRRVHNKCLKKCKD